MNFPHEQSKNFALDFVILARACISRKCNAADRAQSGGGAHSAALGESKRSLLPAGEHEVGRQACAPQFGVTTGLAAAFSFSFFFFSVQTFMSLPPRKSQIRRWWKLSSSISASEFPSPPRWRRIFRSRLATRFHLTPRVCKLLAFTISRLLLAAMQWRVEYDAINAIAKNCDVIRSKNDSQLFWIEYRGTSTKR